MDQYIHVLPLYGQGGISHHSLRMIRLHFVMVLRCWLYTLFAIGDYMYTALCMLKRHNLETKNRQTHQAFTPAKNYYLCFVQNTPGKIILHYWILLVNSVPEMQIDEPWWSLSWMNQNTTLSGHFSQIPRLPKLELISHGLLEIRNISAQKIIWCKMNQKHSCYI